MSSSRRLPAYALIIAINDLNGVGLQAPEPDAIKLSKTLASMGVPYIEMLTGPAATRQAIIQKLADIADNRRIVDDAPIIIYFGGHARRQLLAVPGVVPYPAEFLVPYDTLLSEFRRTSPVPPIPDVTISALLGRIARRKSKHITLLLDCCHAGSGSRDDDVDNAIDLALEVDLDKLIELDKDLWSELPSDIDNPSETNSSSRVAQNNRTSSLRYGGITSHVLIASCREDQLSQEYRTSYGCQALFTTALIEALIECKEDNVIWTVTPIGLFERIKMIMEDMQHRERALRPQHPQCEGYYKDRPIFSTPARPHGSHAIAPVVERGGRIILPVGLLAGIERHSVFDIYDYPQGRLKQVDRLRVHHVLDSEASLVAGHNLDLGPDAYAVMCTPPTALPVEMVVDFPALYNDKSFQASLVNTFGSHGPLGHFISPVRSKGKLSASYMRPDQFELRNVHGGVLRFRGISQVPDALYKAAMFFHHLGQTAPSPLASTNMISVFVVQLAEAYQTDVLREVNALAPRGQPTQIHPTRAYTVPVSDELFGLQILNNGAYNLYVYVFYFDPNDYSITPIYLPATSDIPLPAASGLVIGYGSSGAAPLSFTLANGAHEDKGFIKVYYSTFLSQLGSIQQDGFEEGRKSRPGDSPHHLPHHLPPQLPSVSGSITYPVTVFDPRSRH
ncbi:ICE-like protease (caspase) p20 domain protein [Ceratobasidium sp. AG-Ba]|nr:ICE-like protease (caspase) p20 domain protein [Ceratobasidium sp. AG-Ba]